jgi:hypothetical protein
MRLRKYVCTWIFRKAYDWGKKYYYGALNMKVIATWLPATRKSNKGAYIFGTGMKQKIGEWC